MQGSLAFLLVLISAFYKVKGFSDYDMFSPEYSEDPAAPFSDPSSDLIAWDDPTGELNQDENAPLDMFSPLPEGGETEPDFVVADCLAPDRLGARDDTTLCPTDDFKPPELPTLDRFTNKFIPPDERDDVLKEISPFSFSAPAGDDNGCPPFKPYRLCCICDGHFDFEFCQDCLQMAAVGMCFSPHIEVCCEIYGVVTHNTPKLSFTNLDELLARYPREELHLDMRPQGGTIAQSCQGVVPPV